MSFRALLVVLLLAVCCAPRTRAEPGVTPHVTAQLVTQTDGVAPASGVVVAVVLSADPGWHTYWRNPGDAGEATTIRWSLPSGWRAGEIVWPAPRRLPAGPITNYGYEGQVLLPTLIQAPADARPGDRVAIAASVDYLVCAAVQCIPGSAALKIVLPIVSGLPPLDPHWGPAVQAAVAAAPKSAGLSAAYQRNGDLVRLAVAGTPLEATRGSDAYFFPFDDNLIDHAKDQSVELGARGLTLTMTASPSSARTAAAARVRGVLKVDGKAFEIDAVQGPPPLGAGGLGRPAAGGVVGSLVLAIVLAFAGGIILNLMPCVFPILSMKAIALTSHGENRPEARRNALAFVAGVVASFLLLAGALIAARAGGAAIGWGFQLQSPIVVALLVLIMFAAALNLSGLYEIGTSIQGLGSGLARWAGPVGSLFTGALAVVVAAPCTAPFMGPALGYALTQPAVVGLTVFVALGLGFAAPFTLLSFSPGLIHRLPPPGPWMETMRKTLAFPLYASAAWLLWVLAHLTGPDGLGRPLTALVLIAAAAWVFGLAQRRKAAGGRSWSLLAVAALVAVLGIGLVASGSYPPGSRQSTTSETSLPSAPFSPQNLAALRAQGRPVLVNFTAAWCVTCQVNERLTFSSPSVAEALRRSGGAYLIADWTSRNATIADALAAQGRVGVPLYLLYGAGGGAPITLPQILTPAIVVDALNRASIRPPAQAAR